MARCKLAKRYFACGIPEMKDLDKRQIVGWIAVGLSTAITCFWAFWGIAENFHEGWWY